jgi:hypothetical protein
MPMPGFGAPPPPPPPSSSRSPMPMPGHGAPPPPPPGSLPEAPPPSGPRLSLGSQADKAEKPDKPEKPGLPKGLHIRVAEKQPAPGAKPAVKPGKPGSVLRRRPTLTPMIKAGIAIAAVAALGGGFFAYRIFFPPPAPPEVKIVFKPLGPPKPVVPAAGAAATAVVAKVAAAPAKLVDSGVDALAQSRAAAQAKVDAAANGEEVTPTPPPDVVAGTPGTQSVLAQATIGSDVKANITRLDTSSAASADFRAFVANANIGGVFQGTPSRALINGRIIREGQVVDDTLGISFERIDSDKKVIYFKDATGAEVSRDY